MNSDNSSYEKAKKRVKELKDFYRHVKVFIIVNGLLYLLKSEILLPYIPEEFWLKPYFFNWVGINVLIWGVILAIHALYLFGNKFPFLKKWEERQIQKYMKQEENHKRYK